MLEKLKDVSLRLPTSLKVCYLITIRTISGLTSRLSKLITLIYERPPYVNDAFITHNKHVAGR